MKSLLTATASALALTLAFTCPSNAQHGHINAGFNPAANKLEFKNAAEFAYDFVSNSGYVMNLPRASLGGIANHYGGTAYHTAWTPTALRGTNRRWVSTAGGSYQLAEPLAPTANGSGYVRGADSGSYLNMTLVSIEKLGGSATSFSIWGGSQTVLVGEWDVAALGEGSLASGSATFNLTADNSIIGDGTTPLPGTVPIYPNAFSATQMAAGFRWNVAPGDPISSAIEPFGHIHGRNFATNADGEFRLVWQITDANGIHAPSDFFEMRFSAVPEPGVVFFLAVAGIAFFAVGWSLRIRRAGS